MFYKFLLLTLLAFISISAVGCVHPVYSGDPIRRSQQLIYSSENLRLIHDEYERFWMLDQPSHMTPYRTHGGII